MESSDETFDGGQPLTERATLHRISIKARPLPGHPKYYDWQFGYLSLWLYANSIEDARNRALLIVGALPYELIGDMVSVETGYQSTEESRAMQDRAQDQAEQIGFAMRLHAVVTGAGDEDAFESAPL